MSGPTKPELVYRIQQARDRLTDLLLDNMGHPNEDIRNIVSELIEIRGILDGQPEHDV